MAGGLSPIERRMFETTGYDDVAGELGKHIFTYRQRLAAKIPQLFIDVFVILKGYDHPEGIKNDWPQIIDHIEVANIRYIEDIHAECERILRKVGRLPPMP